METFTHSRSSSLVAKAYCGQNLHAVKLLTKLNCSIVNENILKCTISTDQGQVETC